MKPKLTALLLLFLFIEMSLFSQADKADLPESYDFTWQYTLLISSKKDTNKMIYFLDEDQPYYGFEIEDKTGKTPQGAMFMVFDKPLGTTITFMSFGGKNIGQLMKMPEVNVNEDNLEDYDFKEIDKKTILGYECQGFQMENDKQKMTMYLLKDAPVSFNDLFQFDSSSVPKGFNSEWLGKAENSLIMEMEYIDKKKSKNNSTMECIGLEEKNFSILTGNYTFMKF